KLVAIPGGYRHTTFGIQIDWIAASKHVSPRLFLDQFGADRPLCPTLSHKKTLYAALIRSQATGITKSAQNASILRELTATRLKGDKAFQVNANENIRLP